MSSRTGNGQRIDPRLYDVGIVAAVLLAVVAAALASVVVPVVVAATAIVVVGVALIGRRPDIATLAVLALLYSNAPVVAVNHHGVPFAVATAVPVLLLVPLVHHVVVKRRPLRLGIAGPIMVLFAVAHLASTAVTTDWSTSASTLLAYLTNGLALYLLVVNVLRSEHLVRRAALVTVGVAAFTGLVSLVHTLISDWPETRVFGFSELVRGDLLVEVDWEQYFSVDHPEAELRATGPIGEANFYAFVLLLVLPYAIAFLTRPTDRVERVVGSFSVPLLAAGIVVTYSRGAAVVIAAVTGLFAVVGLIPRRTLLALAAGGGALLLAVSDFAQRLLRLATAPRLWLQGVTDVGDAALTGRYSEMVSAALAWGNNPVLGLGPGMFPANYQRYANELGYDVHDGPREAHNLYLHIAAELGTVGLVLLIALLFVLVRELLGIRRLTSDAPARAFTTAGIAVITIVVVNGLFLHLAFERYLWLHVGLIAAWCLERRRSVAAERQLGPDPASPDREALLGVGGTP